VEPIFALGHSHGRSLLRGPDQPRRASAREVQHGLVTPYSATEVADNPVQGAASGREKIRICRPGGSGPHWVFRRRGGVNRAEPL
jgi:hypothetical protein